MTGDPFGFALQKLFEWLVLGPVRIPDLVAYGALFAGIAAAVALPLPVRPVPPVPERPVRARRLRRRAALLLGLAVPGTWDLLAGRAGLGALQALLFGTCYAVARATRGEGFLASIALPARSLGYFGDVPAGVAYLAPPALAEAAALLALALFVANVPLTLWRARR